jgi:diguanylate cyclase (GGDEF)-like protein
VITREQAQALREQLLAALAEDAHNAQRLLARLDSISRESGIEAHAALLLILTRLGFEEQEARHHWNVILEHRARMTEALGRDVGVRVAVLDYFVNVNRKLVQPTLIDVTMLDLEGGDAGRDRLTGIASERAFRTTLQSELRRARRYEQKVAVVVLDLDEFSAVNARAGELVGDRLLREAAILLSNNVRDIDLAARLGEDEFALLLPETDRNGGLLVAERARREIERFFAAREVDGRPAGLTLSCGVASYPEDASTAERLLEAAAQALYLAKASGRNGAVTYRPERRRFLRFELEPGRFEIEVLAPPDLLPGSARDLSRNGILFSSPERLEIGEPIEIRLADEAQTSLRLRGTVVRLEELAPPLEPGAATAGDRYEVGVALEVDSTSSQDTLLALLEQVQVRRRGTRG